jgi:peptide/nickel transport system permease protein
VGLLAGHFRGKTDIVLSRLVDMTMAIPTLLLVILLSGSLKPGLSTVVIAISAVAWVPYARVVRSQALSTTQRDFVSAARSSGATELRLVFRHILPNVVNSVIVLSSVQIGTLIIAEASLSFLGLGIQPPNTSWGMVVAGGRNYISTAWWLTVIPGLAIMLTVLGFNLLGNWLGDRLDPVRRLR